MEAQLAHSLEAIANLLYLTRQSLADPARASAYIDFAEKILASIESEGRRHPQPGGAE